MEATYGIRDAEVKEGRKDRILTWCLFGLAAVVVIGGLALIWWPR